MNTRKFIQILFLFTGLIYSCSLSAQVNDSLVLPYYLIDSSPQNAGVYIDGILFGETPQRVLLTDSTEKKVVVKLKGYLEYSFNISHSDMPANKKITLIPSTGNNVKKTLVEENRGYYFSHPRKIIPITVSALITAASGISAYYFKSLAINNNDDYNIHHDPSSLDRKRKYDIISGVSLGVLEIGFSALLYYLLLDN